MKSIAETPTRTSIPDTHLSWRLPDYEVGEKYTQSTEFEEKPVRAMQEQQQQQRSYTAPLFRPREERRVTIAEFREITGTLPHSDFQLRQYGRYAGKPSK